MILHSIAFWILVGLLVAGFIADFLIGMYERREKWEKSAAKKESTTKKKTVIDDLGHIIMEIKDEEESC
ncbi:MAG: hypothetical protein K0041_08770 [Acidithiobacillus sp.]|nr:hypothetical protein [Acidithiobacillus sp.]